MAKRPNRNILRTQIRPASISRAFYCFSVVAAVLALVFLAIDRWWASLFGLAAVAFVYWGSQIGTWRE